ncbi:hypothetical protein LP420_33475 [Massilia sp. B-10]|nr:hypothetical protein LP420_33475 [Massilia sp. B-10]
MFAPLMQAIISSAYWVVAMLTMAATTLLTIPLAWPLRKGAGLKADPAALYQTGGSARHRPWRADQDQLRDPSYLFLHAGFFTCGFHIAFLVTHLPNEVALCNLLKLACRRRRSR